jgi:polyhydroxybutyrate depolymerase
MLSKKLAAAAALVAALAATAPAAAHARQSPLPPGACVTHGAAGLAYGVGVNCRTVEHDGIARRYIVYVPSHPIPAGGAPVVLMFHGSSGTGERFLKISGWRQQAERTGLVAVFPTGLRYRVLESGRRSTKWNDFGLASKVDLDERPRGYPEDSPMPADDVGFVDAIMADVGARLPIDRHRVYASGFSNGANFTARLSVERSNRLAAVAYSAGGLDEAQDTPDRPVPTYVSVGTRDDRILEGTGLAALPLNPVEILTSPVVAPFIRDHLATLGLDENQFGAIARRRATTLRWPATGSGPGGAVFQFGMLAGVRHKYPNGANNPAGFEAAPEFWEFFENHPLP